MVEIRKTYVDTSIGQVHCRLAGTGEPMVLLHQTATSSEVYEPLMGYLASDVWVVAMDTPGFGMSPFPPHHYDIADYARILVEVLDGLEIASASIFGHHTGASIACELAAAAPERVRKLILSSPICYEGDERERRLERVKATFPSLVPDDDGIYLVKAWRDLVERQEGWNIDPQQKNREMVWKLKAGPRYKETAIAVFGYDMPARLPLVEAPTLVIAGQHDPHRNAADHAARLLRQGHHNVVPGGRHWLEIEQVQELAKLILDFQSGS